MGFRSTTIAQDYGVTWPVWFIEKYKDDFYFEPNGHSLLATKVERKAYEEPLCDLPEDVQKAFPWEEYPATMRFRPDGLVFILVYLHECGGVSRCHISKNRIRWSEPLPPETKWTEVANIQHSYCVGCADLDEPKE